ncbi:cryptochrome/photolyase family protein [Phytoactinopolyspora mesophila]|uniref:Deoxyribodipyrimidine photo-lyase n=1 Tax=Phytoactinopolyspora mesophila TaxID=2650750 RepID=A0A7K3LYG7_9ACTN|nr:deoxyribodipyrimidine photo-lyase [Phytoactinopolyspora mesophila]NDL55722.1 deoxyribodipyrimidine photo-lyase [Phytoactinopolyspora mesophila]
MTVVVLFTRDLRVYDQPVLSRACREYQSVVPLFVVDERIRRSAPASPNRAEFLAAALADLRSSLRTLGADLVIRRGDVIAETLRVVAAVGASAVFVTADVSGYAQARARLLLRESAQAGIRVEFGPGVTVVPAGELTPAGGDHYRVFTPYFRAWQQTRWRHVVPAPPRVPFRQDVEAGPLPAADDIVAGQRSPVLPEGGESAGLRALEKAVRVARLGGQDRDDLAADQTTRLSPYLHFGCLSALHVARRFENVDPDVVRQLAWRDFMHQVTMAFPDMPTHDYRPRDIAWRDDSDALTAWQEGRTGMPIVDAGMRQLLAEGWMHNRARLITASFLTKTLRVDWRHGAAHFARWLVDGDIANNAGGWQWMAGTGNDTRPNRVLNPIRQARRFDPTGVYVRRYVPELADVAGADVHEPWRLPERSRARLEYPPPLIEPAGAPRGHSAQPPLWSAE